MSDIVASFLGRHYRGIRTGLSWSYIALLIIFGALVASLAGCAALIPVIPVAVEVVEGVVTASETACEAGEASGDLPDKLKTPCRVITGE